MNRHRVALATAVLLVGLASFAPIIPATEEPAAPTRVEEDGNDRGDLLDF